MARQKFGLMKGSIGCSKHCHLSFCELVHNTCCIGPLWYHVSQQSYTCHSYEYMHINIYNRHKGICRWSSRAKSERFSPTEKQVNEREQDSGEDGLEMKDLVATVEEHKDKYCFEDSSNIGTFYQQLPSVFISMDFSAVTSCNDIPEDDFPDHVKEMHQDRDQKFEMEYKVSTSS